MRRISKGWFHAFLVALLVGILPVAAIAADQRSYAQSPPALELDGAVVGWLYSSEGGNATSDVVVEKLGSNQVQKKHIAGVKYGEITVTCGPNMAKPFLQWIKDTLDHKYSRKSGAIVYTDYNRSVTKRLNFYNALITEIGFPALDAGSKDAARLTVKFLPEYTRLDLAKGGALKMQNTVQEKWLSSNFRLTIPGLDTTRVNKIDALTVRQKVAVNAAGAQRDYQKEPVVLEVPNVAVEMAETNSKTFFDWHNDFVIKGNNGDNREKTGTLEFLSPALKPLFTLSLKGVGIFKVETAKPASGSEAISRVRAEMYCEEMTFTSNLK